MRRGKDRGKQGKVLRVDAARGRVSVEGVNLVKKHVRARRQGEKGESVSVPRSAPLSAVALYCGTCGRGVRTGVANDSVEPDSNGEKVRARVCRRCGNKI